MAQRPSPAASPAAAPSVAASPAKPVPAEPAMTEDQQRAQQHFQRARELYQTGSYREAVGELEAARALDPKAKDLLFNLAIVREKLGRYDEAIADLRAYLELDLSPQERAKAESSIKRLEGAKRENPAATPTVSPTPDQLPVEPAEAPPPPPARGRIDAITIAAGSVAVVGLAVGTIFGIRAVATRPSNFVTGRDGSYADFQDRTDSAHTSAIIADVSLGIGIVAAAATAWFYFSRTKEPAPAHSPSSAKKVGGLRPFEIAGFVLGGGSP